MRAGRRRHRFKLSRLTKVYRAEDKSPFGYVRNLSHGGMMVFTHLQPEQGTFHNLMIEVPETFYPKPIAAYIEIVWLGGTNEFNNREVGCKFVMINNDGRSALLKLAMKYGIPDKSFPLTAEDTADRS